MTYNFKTSFKMNSKETILGLVIPFVLFWGGILTPVFTDNLIVWLLSLVPFYGFVIGCDEFLRHKMEDKYVFIKPLVLGFLSSIFLLSVLFIVGDVSECLKNVCLLGGLNIVPSIVISSLKLYLPVDDCEI